jgi:CarD family transcriptional regulator
MYNVGDKIVYPMHGAGIIESIEEREILGKRCSYYIMKIPIGDLKVMIPTNNVEGIGIRDVISISEADMVFKTLAAGQHEFPSNWNKRYRENMVKIKSGDIFEVADVVRSLMQRDRDKGLSTGERKMLNSAKQILVSELVLAKGLNQHEVEDRIQEYMAD